VNIVAAVVNSFSINNFSLGIAMITADEDNRIYIEKREDNSWRCGQDV